MIVLLGSRSEVTSEMVAIETSIRERDPRLQGARSFGEHPPTGQTPKMSGKYTELWGLFVSSSSFSLSLSYAQFHLDIWSVSGASPGGTGLKITASAMIGDW